MPSYLTIRDIKKHLKLTRQTVSKYIQEGNLKAKRIGGKYFIAESDYLNFTGENRGIAENGVTSKFISRNCILMYEGKKDEGEILNYSPTGSIRSCHKASEYPHNSFYFGDNRAVLSILLERLRGKVDLIYIDPPFGTGQIFSNLNDELAYLDTVINHGFLEFLRERFFYLREFLSEKGTIYLHIDKKLGHYVKIIMDEIFGSHNFINEITRVKCNPKNFDRRAYGNISDTILVYAKKYGCNIWNDQREELSDEQLKKLFPRFHPLHGRYTTNPLHAPGKTLNGDTGEPWKNLLPPKGRHWRYARKELTRLDQEGLIEWSKSGNPRKIILACEHKGAKIQDIWEFKDKGMSYSDYPTQKNCNMLKRIIRTSSNEGGIVMDCFAGAGGTLVVADQLKRKWLGIDNSFQSYKIIRKILGQNNINCNYYEYKEEVDYRNCSKYSGSNKALMMS